MVGLTTLSLLDRSAILDVVCTLSSPPVPAASLCPHDDSFDPSLVEQDSLGGTAYTVVCCNVSPIEASEPETLSTLRFAERLKKVREATSPFPFTSLRDSILDPPPQFDLDTVRIEAGGVLCEEFGVRCWY